MKTKNKFIEFAEDVFYTGIWLIGYLFFMIFMGIAYAMVLLMDLFIDVVKSFKSLFILEDA